MFEVSMFGHPAFATAPAPAPASAAQASAQPGAWTAQRRAPRQTDHVLTDATRTWLHRLPPRRRPLRLAAQFPRVVNRIALCWGEPALAEQVLDDLLVDRRSGRRGFPLLVARELHRLRDYRLA